MSPHMLRNSLKAPLAVALSGGLALGGLSLSASPASAEVPSTLTWKVSDQFAGHLGTHQLSGGATEDAAKVVTFPGGEGGVEADGSGTVSYDGSVAGSFAFGGTTYYSVTLAEPTVTVDADGNGTITAVVSAQNAAAQGNPAASTTPARVTVAEFDSEDGFVASGEGTTLTATPAWDNVMPAGGERALALGLPAGQPIGGKSWHPDIFDQLTPGVRPHFYATADNNTKAPAPFTATAPPAAAPAPSVQYQVVGSNKNGLQVKVDGAGFNATTNPGDAGVYVGIARAGGLPDTSEFDLSAFAAADWVMPNQMPGGSFSKTLTAPITKLDPKRTYSIYTWQAHTHSNPSQDTETRVSIDFATLKVASATTASWAKKPTRKAKGKIAAKVKAKGLAVTPEGKVAVTLKQGKASKKANGTLKAGKVTITLPKLAKGTWKATVTYGGQGSLQKSTAKLTATVK